MTVPTLYLAGLQARKFHGPGRKLCAMVLPRRWEHGDGRVAIAAPSEADLRAVRVIWDLAAYRAACERWWGVFASLHRYDPGVLSLVSVASNEADGRARARPVADGDTLFCGCAAPDSPRRKHPCHICILAPFLARAGWRVVLWGRALFWDGRGCRWEDTGEEMTPEQFGWPNTETIR